jgi:hypothetical protein
MYQALFAVLKRLDPEFTHHLGMLAVRAAGPHLADDFFGMIELCLPRCGLTHWE